MAQVQSSPFGGLGLYATKEFKEGDVILQEDPLATLAPANDEESNKLALELGLGLALGDEKTAANSQKKKKVSLKSETPPFPLLWESIQPPSSVAKELHGKFKGMVQAGLCCPHDAKTKQALLKLYHPTNNEPTTSTLEGPIVDCAKQAVEYIQQQQQQQQQHDVNNTNMTTNTDPDDVLQNIMLVWACNSFQGGRIYQQISRVNHSCNPNALIVPNGESQKLVAAATIQKGDEIAISYLGLMLYAEMSLRRDRLQHDKYFVCTCARCTSSCSSSSNDLAARIPCPTCHPRQAPQQVLDEEVQYDDDQTTSYITRIDDATAICQTCQTKPKDRDTAKLEKVMSSVCQKIVSYLQEQESSDHNKKTNTDTVDDDDEDEEEQVLEEYVGLAGTVMGDKHWTTNLLLLMHLNRRLSSLSQQMLTTQEPPGLDDVAEAIDSLERVVRFVQGLELSLHMGHVLDDCILGVARALVSLGDSKSQKYAAVWLEKMQPYVDLFETEGRQKVVQALSVAWKQHEHGDDGVAPTKKKAKTSK
jgi:hypothetical protein